METKRKKRGEKKLKEIKSRKKPPGIETSRTSPKIDERKGIKRKLYA